MAPKTPSKLREQIKKQNAEQPPAEGHDRTAEGLEVERPKRSEFFANLEKVAKQPPPNTGS